MKHPKLIITLLILAISGSSVYSDTPANCTYEDIKGAWKIYEGPRGQSKHFDCTNYTNLTNTYYIYLSFPDIATDDQGNVGFWTLIYNQGFEIVINNRKYFSFSYFRQDGQKVTSFCNHTFVSYSHQVGVDPVDWSCFAGDKDDDPLSASQAKTHIDAYYLTKDKEALLENRLFKRNERFVKEINAKQSSWQATHYPQFEKYTIGEMIRLAGGKKSRGFSKPKPAPIDEMTKKIADSLPTSFDWRNVNGVNYVSPIRNQQSCGSCYTFGSMAMHEARLRIYSNNTKQTVFSTQDIVECSVYSQGCEGGFPYLVAGKYSEDFGVVEEACNPYTGKDGQCTTSPQCQRYYATDYKYLGGFYGACNEALMRIELVKNGPLAVSFEVYDDFLNYKSGIYRHTGVRNVDNFGFNPFELTNHVVAIVGYGQDVTSGELYWIVKNSWGTGWGENGFFRIARQTDECAIESIAVSANIIV